MSYLMSNAIILMVFRVAELFINILWNCKSERSAVLYILHILKLQILSLCRMPQSSFPNADENILALSSNALTARQLHTETVHQQFSCTVYILWLWLRCNCSIQFNSIQFISSTDHYTWYGTSQTIFIYITWSL
jgi:hypothetical protein